MQKLSSTLYVKKILQAMIKIVENCIPRMSSFSRLFYLYTIYLFIILTDRWCL